MSKNNKEKITKLRLKNEIKDFLIKELLVIITNNKIKVPESLIKKINILFAEEIK